MPPAPPPAKVGQSCIIARFRGSDLSLSAMCVYACHCVCVACQCAYVCVYAVYVCVYRRVCGGGSKQGKGEEIESPPENLRSKVVVTKMSCILTVGDSLLWNGLKAKNAFCFKGRKKCRPKGGIWRRRPKGKVAESSRLQRPVSLPSGSLKLLTPL